MGRVCMWINVLVVEYTPSFHNVLGPEHCGLSLYLHSRCRIDSKCVFTIRHIPILYVNIATELWA